jgi:hypothetical protein
VLFLQQDIAERAVVNTIPSGSGPNGISFSPLAPAPASSTRLELTMPDEMDDMDGMDGMDGMDTSSMEP